jgi:heme-degrading monooxygenase HmoA
VWAQIVKARLKSGVEQDIAEIADQVKARVSNRPGLVNAYWMRDRHDPQMYYTVIVFESEEQARQGERQLDQDPLFQRMHSLEEGTPEYVDLDVIQSM